MEGEGVGVSPDPTEGGASMESSIRSDTSGFRVVKGDAS